jgi:AcrR family transcriptional regulator
VKDRSDTEVIAKTKGRPREFDTEVALDAALRVFWDRGYEGTSLPDLTQAMGINRPSLYAAFGNKETLFRTVVDRYAKQACGIMSAALAAPRARDAIAQLLAMAVGCAKSDAARGCILVQGALVCGDEATAIKRDLTQMRNATESAVKTRLERALAEGDLKRGTNVAALAKFVATFQHGISVQSAGGTPRAALQGAVEIAMLAIDACCTAPSARRRK